MGPGSFISSHRHSYIIRICSPETSSDVGNCTCHIYSITILSGLSHHGWWHGQHGQSECSDHPSGCRQSALQTCLPGLYAWNSRLYFMNCNVTMHCWTVMLFSIRRSSRSLLTGKEMQNIKGKISRLRWHLATQMCWWGLVIILCFIHYLCLVNCSYCFYSHYFLLFILIISFRNCCSSLSSVYHFITGIRGRAGVPPSAGRGGHGHVSCWQIYRYTHTCCNNAHNFW